MRKLYVGDRVVDRDTQCRTVKFNVGDAPVALAVDDIKREPLRLHHYRRGSFCRRGSL